MLKSRPLLSFVLLAYGFTWALMLPLLLSRRGLVAWGWPSWWEAVVAFGPFVAAWLVLRAAGSAAALQRWWASFLRLDWGRRGLWLAVGSPLLFLAVGVAVHGLVSPDSGRLASPGNDALASVHGFLDLLIVASIAQALGEEPGWRGYYLERLRERRGPLVATLLLFPAWLLWHLPMFLSRPELGPGQFAAFALGILSAAVWLTAIREATHSIAAAFTWHALVNLARGVALGLSTLAFLAFGVAVTAGAVALAVAMRRGTFAPGRMLRPRC